MDSFDDTLAPSGLGELWLPTRLCPACGGAVLRRVRAGDASRWLCVACGRCVRAERGGLRRVDPLECPGCATRARPECIALLQAEFPRFGAGTGTDETGGIDDTD
jgi:hypothetical protein